MGPLIFLYFFEKGIDKHGVIVYNNIASERRREKQCTSKSRKGSITSLS